MDLDKETRKEVKKQINKMMQLSKLSNVARKWFPIFGMGELVPFYRFSFNAGLTRLNVDNQELHIEC